MGLTPDQIAELRPLACLARAADRDAEKGGAGLRTAAEVAAWCGITPNAARRQLYELHERGEAECFGHVGATIEWRITDLGRAALNPESKP